MCWHTLQCSPTWLLLVFSHQYSPTSVSDCWLLPVSPSHRPISHHQCKMSAINKESFEYSTQCVKSLSNCPYAAPPWAPLSIMARIRLSARNRRRILREKMWEMTSDLRQQDTRVWHVICCRRVGLQYMAVRVLTSGHSCISTSWWIVDQKNACCSSCWMVTWKAISNRRHLNKQPDFSCTW